MTYRLTGIVRDLDQARRGRPALRLNDQIWSYADLDARSSRAANALHGAGCRAGQRVAYLDSNAPEFFELLFGAAKIGAVLAPVNWRLTAAEATAIVRDSGATLLVHGPGFAALGAAITADTGVRTVSTGPQYEGWLAAADPTDPGFTGADDTVVLQLSTSGTTGLPKGAMLTNANLAALQAASRSWRIDADSVSLVAMPLFHVGGSGWALVGLQCGALNVLLPALDPAGALAVMESHRVTHAFLVPAALAMLAAVPGAAERNWDGLAALIYGASPITVEALKKVMAVFGAPMYQVYGMTETTGAITQLDPGDHDPGGPREHLLRSAGRPYPWVQTRIVDVVTGLVLGPAEVGELQVRSAQVCAGYYAKPAETAAAMEDGGWLHTGDAGYLDADGYLFLTDRIKDMIVSGGENVYPAEVENVLAGHPSVLDVAVIGVPDQRWGETVKAIVVTRPGTAFDAQEILAWAAPRLAGFKRPRSVDRAEQLPRNPSGKVQKRELRARYWAGQDRGIS